MYWCFTLDTLTRWLCHRSQFRIICKYFFSALYNILCTYLTMYCSNQKYFELKHGVYYALNINLRCILDRRQQYVGKVETMSWDQTGKRILVATERNVIASLSSNNGSIGELKCIPFLPKEFFPSVYSWSALTLKDKSSIYLYIFMDTINERMPNWKMCAYKYNKCKF